jgi:hypothetical protein
MYVRSLEILYSTMVVSDRSFGTFLTFRVSRLTLENWIYRLSRNVGMILPFYSEKSQKRAGTVPVSVKDHYALWNQLQFHKHHIFIHLCIKCERKFIRVYTTEIVDKYFLKTV